MSLRPQSGVTLVHDWIVRFLAVQGYPLYFSRVEIQKTRSGKAWLSLCLMVPIELNVEPTLFQPAGVQLSKPLISSLLRPFVVGRSPLCKL